MSTTIVWAWKYGRSFLNTIMRANAIRSNSVHLTSASVNTLHNKYIGFCLSSSSDRTKVALKAEAEVAKYRNMKLC